MRHNKRPHKCAYCGKPIEADSDISGATTLVIHHLDGDRKNNDPKNLVAMHRGCHTRKHHIGKVRTEESKQRQRDAIRQKKERYAKLERMAKKMGI
jgi:5-methylcytosine-specific restriction endonuclease McrA